MTDRNALILDAQRKGFGVLEGEEGWLVAVPARPRLPAHHQGTHATAERAWMSAALLAKDYP